MKESRYQRRLSVTPFVSRPGSERRQKYIGDLVKISRAARSDNRHRHCFKNCPRKLQIIAAACTVCIYRIKEYLARAQLHGFYRPVN